MSRRPISLLIAGILLCIYVQAQQDSSQVAALISPRYMDKVGAEAEAIDKKLDRKTAKLLRNWQRQEQRMARRLAGKDSLKAAQLGTESAQRLEQLQVQMKRGGSLQQYIPNLDTSLSSLKFLQANPKLLSSVKDADKLTGAFTRVKGMEGKFQQAELVQKFLEERKARWKDQLANLPFGNELKRLNKQAYYYRAQVEEYRSMLKDHKKAERKALALLSRTKLYRDFMHKNSQLSQLFRPPFDPADPASMANMAGLQTRAQVNGLIQQQIAAGGPGAMAQVQQNIQDAQAKMNELKDKILKAGGSGGDANMPEGFRPNSQKTRSFFKRLEYGTNIQSVRASGYWPTTTDIGLSIGYKLSDKGIIGLGGSYKVGWGRNIRHIHITHQGIGLRSFIDWKIKGSFWITGGYESNYRSEIKDIDVLKDRSAWQESGLIGMTKVISLKTKFFKKTKVSLLWDFLSYKQAPRAQPVLFRIGYTF